MLPAVRLCDRLNDGSRHLISGASLLRPMCTLRLACNSLKLGPRIGPLAPHDQLTRDMTNLTPSFAT